MWCATRRERWTKGVFEVTQVEAAPGFDKEELLEMAAQAESYSKHPISRSLKEAYEKSTGKQIDTSGVTEVEELSGHGVSAVIGGKKVAAGNAKFMKRLNILYTVPQKQEQKFMWRSMAPMQAIS